MRTLKSDVALNLSMSFLGILGTMWTLWLASRVLSPVALGLFLLIRRLADSGSQFMHLGAPISLRRYLTISVDAEERAANFSAALTLSLIGIVAFGALLVANPHFWTRVLIGSAQTGDDTILYVGFMSVALVFHYLANSALLWRGYIATANLVEVFNVALVPIAAMYIIAGIDARRLVAIQAAGMGLVSAGVLAIIRWRLSIPVSAPDRVPARAHLLENLSYGLPRAVGLALETSFLVIGPWFLRNDLAAVGYLTIAFFMLRFARTIVQPVTILIAMRLGGLHSRGASHDVRRGLDFVIAGVLMAVAAILPAIHAWSPLIFRIWLGPTLASEVERYAAPLLFAVVPLSLFQALKEPIELMWKKPFVLGIFVAGNLVLVGSYAMLARHFIAGPAVAGAYVAAYCAMTAAALWVVRQNISGFRRFGLERLTLCAGTAWLVNAVAADATASEPLWLRSAVMIAVAGASCALVIAFYLLIAPPPLGRELRKYLWTGSLAPGGRG